MSGEQNNIEYVNVTIDGKPARVPKGTNLIEAAKSVGTVIPHYCYHPKLSIAGNCRMCQVQVKGQPKLTIGCNTVVAEGMEILTQESNQAVADAQAAVLEFILINHPLDCTVCDQAGHCKLQDYHFEYNAKSSRFLEEKEHKVKAIPLGPTVMLDGERCIMCTRCIRFCDEITKTSELGMLNRGDRSVIAVSPGNELKNPLSGTVVDLCPVGALTHKQWRFNTRIWFTKQVDSVCPGCSTGCNSKVATRDGQVVHVKARYNPEVNNEWMCDEGRYGFHRFLPERRVASPSVRDANGEIKETSLSEALKRIKNGLKTAIVFLSPDLLLEEYLLIKKLLLRTGPTVRPVINYKERHLTDVERILVSPDYAANFNGAIFAGLVSGDLEQSYRAAVEQLKRQEVDSVFVIGDRGIDPIDVDSALLDGVRRATFSAGLLSNADSALTTALQTVVPCLSILEKNGLLINRKGRIQYSAAVLEADRKLTQDWHILCELNEGGAQKIFEGRSTPVNERELTRAILDSDDRLRGITIASIRNGGVKVDFDKREPTAQPLEAAALQQ